MANDITLIPAQRVPVMDQTTGLMSREWYRYFFNLFNLTGSGTNTTSLSDVQVGPTTDASVGTMAYVNSDNVRAIGYALYQSPPIPAVPPVGTSWYSANEDTLNLQHIGGVTQQVGLEVYMRVVNHTGVTIANGACVGFAGVNGEVTIEVSPYIANGTVPSLYAIGVATQDIADGSKGRITVWGTVRDIDTTGTPYAETWVEGDILYASPATAGGLTNIKPTAPNVCIPIAAVTQVGAADGHIFVRPTIEQQMYYGQFTKRANQTAAVINTAYAVTLTDTEISNGVTIGTPASRVVAAQSGLYQAAFSAQLISSNSSAKYAYFWFRKNGVDVPNTTTKISIDSNAASVVVVRSEFFALGVNEYIEVMWAVSDLAITLTAAAATAFAPATPAAILSITQIQQ